MRAWVIALICMMFTVGYPAAASVGLAICCEKDSAGASKAAASERPSMPYHEAEQSEPGSQTSSDDERSQEAVSCLSPNLCNTPSGVAPAPATLIYSVSFTATSVAGRLAAAEPLLPTAPPIRPPII